VEEVASVGDRPKVTAADAHFFLGWEESIRFVSSPTRKSIIADIGESVRFKGSFQCPAVGKTARPPNGYYHQINDQEAR